MTTSNPFPLLGFDIGGTKIAVCLGTSDGRMIDAQRISSANRPPQEVIPEMISLAKELLKKYHIKELKAIGIGAPAPMDIANGIILKPTNMPLWVNVPIREQIEQALQAPTYFDNDANAGALAEWFFGAGKGCKNMIYLTLSTGIGGGLIVDGLRVQGKSLLAGELGHICLDIEGPQCNCGNRGCYEAFCGGVALAQKMKQDLKNHPNHLIVQLAGRLENVNLIALEKAARQGDDYAVQVWDQMCLRNAQAIGSLINIFSPERIVLGTIAYAAGDFFMNPVKKYLPQFCWPQIAKYCTVTVSQLGRQIGEWSGICVALNGLYETHQWDPEKNQKD